MKVKNTARAKRKKHLWRGLTTNKTLTLSRTNSNAQYNHCIGGGGNMTARLTVCKTNQAAHTRRTRCHTRTTSGHTSSNY